MPYIAITVSAQPDAALAARIAAEVSALTARLLGKDPAITAVSVSFQDPALWFVGGRPLDQHGVASFWLDIKVVDGTNTKLEMEAYLAAIFAGMARLLGPVHPESYILVHEVPAQAYGFGGITQESRFIRKRLEATAAG